MNTFETFARQAYAQAHTSEFATIDDEGVSIASQASDEEVLEWLGAVLRRATKVKAL